MPINPEILLRQILEWVPFERNKRGRFKTFWIGGIIKAMSEGELNEEQCQDRVEDLETEMMINKK